MSDATDLSDLRLGFIGAGRMATALARGFVSAQLVTAEQISARDPVPAAAESFAADTGGGIVFSNPDLVRASNVVFLAVKPQAMPVVLDEIREHVTTDHLVVSIAAGVTLRRLSDALGDAVRLVRVMPNTPCLIGQGASGYCLSPAASEADGQLVGRLLESVGTAFQLDEKLLDAVTGLSGSGPAFVFLVIEALSDGGVNAGLPRDVATRLAAQTVAGAAQMVLQTGDHPAVLSDRVASPGGTTIRGLQALEAHGVRAGLIRAVCAATERSRELGGG